MTTRDKGITLPAAGLYVSTSGTTVQVTDTPADYTVKNAWNYGAANIAPVNLTVLTATSPANLFIKAQNAIASFSNTGGNMLLQPGIGTGGNSSGNVIISDTAGVSGWAGSHIQLASYHIWQDINGNLRWKQTPPTGDLDGIPVGVTLAASATYDPPSLIDGAGTTTTVACAGASLGDFAQCSFSGDTGGMLLTAWVSAANVVSVRFQNETTGTLDLASGTLRVRVNKL